MEIDTAGVKAAATEKAAAKKKGGFKSVQIEESDSEEEAATPTSAELRPDVNRKDPKVHSTVFFDVTIGG